MTEPIIQFVETQTCASICVVGNDNSPYCFSAYYAFSATDGLLHFKSSPDTTHGKMIEQNPNVAGTILPDKLVKLTTRGIQFTGTVLHGNEPQSKDSANSYYKVFPMAHAVPGQVYTIQLETIKMTDSTLGFGKKILWARAQSLPTN